MKLDLNAMELVRQNNPLIHCISNIVSARDCANLVLAVGARPVMAQEPLEMQEITAAAKALVLNLGTPSEEKYAACAVAGNCAQDHEIPIVLDPVGVGASSYRQGRLFKLLKTVHPNIVRGNLREIQAILRQTKQQGVDSPSEGDLQERIQSASELAKSLKTVVLLSGETDVIADGERIAVLHGGDCRMQQITGAGCMLSALAGVYSAEVPAFEAALTAAACWNACAAKAGPGGPGSFYVGLMDAAARLTQEEVQRSVDCELF